MFRDWWNSSRWMDIEEKYSKKGKKEKKADGRINFSQIIEK